MLAAKAVKNQVEADGMVEGNKRDSCALIEFLAQLEDEVEFGGGQTWDEISAASRQVTGWIVDLNCASEIKLLYT